MVDEQCLQIQRVTPEGSPLPRAVRTKLRTSTEESRRRQDPSNLQSKIKLSDLKQYFIDGIKSPRDLQVGVEWEKIGVYKESGEAIAYSGPRGVERIFKELIKRYHWTPVYSDTHIIALKKKKASITLEPGGQIELSGQKSASLDRNASELYAHLDELKKVSEPMDIAWLGIGLQPVSTLDQIEWVPKKRYQIMRKSLKKKNTLTHFMMKQTASIQVSLDFTSEKDAIEKLRLAMGLAPVLAGMFANSPISGGKLNGYLSKRNFIWSRTAPERSGLIQKVFRPNFGFDDYVDHALKVPLLFIVRGEKWIDAKRMTFEKFLKCGLDGHAATLDDWHLHLTTLFTESRLKKYLEIRSVDCQKKEFGMAVPALLKGIFYDERARTSAWGMVRDLSFQERLKFSEQAALKGLAVGCRGKTLRKMAEKLVGLAGEGLDRLVSRKLASPNEARYLEPLRKLLAQGITPAEILIRCFKNDLSKEEKIKRLLRCAAI